MSKAELNNSDRCEVADILNMGMPAFKKRYGNLPIEHLKAVNALTACRTAELGDHTYACDHCDHTKHVYNSCRNRHCPKCQGLARVKWVDDRMNELLPVEYFHVVFTVPSELNLFVLRNKRTLYNILQRSVSETLRELSENPKHLGAEIGFISVLHTWGQNMMDHPHIHCIIPGGGIKSGGKWKPCKSEFLFPIKVMSRLFKGKFLSAFKDGVQNKSILFHGHLREYADHNLWGVFLDDLYSKEWVVYAKPPFANPEQVIKYLGGYTHRIAISNHRILGIDDDTVTFKWKNYTNANKTQIMRLSIVEFIRRFLLHILPKRYQRIRYYGFLSNRKRKTSLERCFKILGKIRKSKSTAKTTGELSDLCEKIFGMNIRTCPLCKRGVMRPAYPLGKFAGGVF